MRRITWLATILLLATTLGQAGAQPIPPTTPQRPTFSPYLNLLRGGNPGLNYYGLVRPLQQYNDAIGQLQSRAGMANREFNQLEDQLQRGQGVGGVNPLLPTTGYVSRFDDLSGYFGRLGGGAGDAGNAGGSRPFAGIAPAFAPRANNSSSRFMPGGLGGGGAGLLPGAGVGGAAGFGGGIGGAGAGGFGNPRR